MQQPSDPTTDRSTLIGIVLITLILGVWMVYFSPKPPPPPTEGSEEVVAAPDEAAPLPQETAPELAPLPQDSAFAAAAAGTARTVTVETDLYHATFSTRGATLTSFELKKYRMAGEDELVQMIADEDGAIALNFTPPQGRYVDTRALFFRTDASDTVRVTAEGQEIVFEAPIGEGALRYVYGFDADTYGLTLRVEQVGTNVLTASGGYDLVWSGGIAFAENNPGEEAPASGAYVRSGGEVESVTLTSEPAESRRLTGAIEWVAVKNKYFLAALIPSNATEGAEIEGERIGEVDDPSHAETFLARLSMPRPGAEPQDFRLYLGPMELDRIGAYGADLYDVVDYGFGSWMTRPIARFVVAPMFAFFSTFLPNYGLVIILFGVVIKMLLYPLTKSSYKNTARMRELQPKMEAIKEKYGDDPQKQQEAMMKMYRETGINPLAGCLPLLLQYPIIIALWRFFQNSIDIRQQPFLWAADLSAPDPILHLPFSIPFYGDFVAGFTLIMGLAMIVQMKVAMPATGGTSNTQAKIMMYMMPAILFVVFNRLAAGLSLYYLVFNVLTIIQQRLINKETHEEGVSAMKPAKGKVKPNTNGKASANGQGAKANLLRRTRR